MSRARLEFLLLGKPIILLDGLPLPVHRRKTAALLISLACRSEALGRSAAAGLLWPESPPDRARQSLRQAIFDASSLAGRGLISGEEGYIGLAENLEVSTDLAHFEGLASAGLAEIRLNPDQARTLLQEARILYRGEFLEGFYLSDAVEFEDWQLGEAERLSLLCQKVDAGLEEVCLARGFPQWGRASPKKLPEPATSLIGRETELGKVLAHLAVGKTVCLTGPGGIGKTRVAIEAARRASSAYTEGASFIDLAPCTRNCEVPSAIAAALGIRLGRGGILDLAGGLKTRSMILLLDNCEHVVDGAAEAAAGLGQGCPGIAILATSRERLGIPGEVILEIPPLGLPGEAGARDQASRILEADAPRLLIHLCQSERPGWAPRMEDIIHIGAICKRLDGLPLALELAAPRMATLGSAGLRTLLEARISAPIDLLDGSIKPAREAHRALRALFDWSSETLGADEGKALPRLAVFRGSFSLEAALAIGGTGEASLLGLVEKALVTSLEAGAGPRRFRLLETIKAYAYRRLEERGEVESAKSAHFGFFSGLALGQEKALRELRNLEDLRSASRELDEFEAAIRYGLELPGLLAQAASMARALVSLFSLRGTLGRLGELVRDIEAAGGEHIEGSAAADLAYAKGHSLHGDYDAEGGKKALCLAARLYNEEGNDLMEAYSLSHAGTGVDNWHAGDGLCLGPQQALAIFRRIGDRPGMADAFLALGKGMLFSRNDAAEAGRTLAEGRPLILEHGAIPVQTEYWVVLANLADYTHDAPNVAVFLERADSLGSMIDDPSALADAAFLRASRAYRRHAYAEGLAAAQDYHRQLGRLSRPIESAKALRLISAGLFLLGRTEESFATEEEALGIARACGHADEIGLHRQTLACMEMGMGRHEKGLAMLKDLVAIARQDPTGIGLPRNVFRLARYYSALGMVPEAIAAFQEVIGHPAADYIAMNAKVLLCSLEPLGPYPLALLERLSGLIDMDYAYWSHAALGLGLRLIEEGSPDFGLEVAIQALASRLSAPPIFWNIMDWEEFRRIAALLRKRFGPGMEKSLTEAIAFCENDEAGFHGMAIGLSGRLVGHYRARDRGSRP